MGVGTASLLVEGARGESAAENDGEFRNWLQTRVCAPHSSALSDSAVESDGIASAFGTGGRPNS